MRFVGLTLCLLVSSIVARAETAEERITALEARVKALELALREAGGKFPTASAGAGLDGTYKATLSNGKELTLELQSGKVSVSMDADAKSGTYEAIGQRLVVHVEGTSETLEIDGGHLRGVKGNEKIDFVRIK